MTEFLLELYSEEIPARMQEAAAMELAGKISADAKYFYTPQRLVVVADLADSQPDQVVDKRGPKVGAPDAAVAGFLKSVGLADVAQAEVIEVKRESYYYYKNTVKGVATKDYLATALPRILAEFTWPKSMRWGAGEIRWVRPLHSIIALFGGEVVTFNFGDVVSGDVTRGHRFLDGSQFAVRSSQEYFEGLKKRFVIVDAEERKKIILDGARKAAGDLKLDEDERLLKEVANLVEYPVVLRGEFDAEFLQVPQECLISTMKTNQKYFPLFNANGKLANKFIIVSNMIADDGGKQIIAGNERVIKARLSDAKFFWDQDRKQNLEFFMPKLESVIFHTKIGNMHQKAKQLRVIAKFIANLIGADAEAASRAAYLCKADLVSGMVGEFAELQGIMGAYYAAEQGEKQEVAAAIREHYLPAGPSDAVPTAPVSICVALADKIYSLVQLFEAGEIPSGSRDPFGLRRSALGIIRIILENNLKISLKSLIIQAGNGADASENIFQFFIERLRQVLKTENIRHDYITAVFDGKNDNLVDIKNRAESLAEFLTTATGANLLAAYKRAANILAIEEKRDKRNYIEDPELARLIVAPEKDLFATINDSEPIIAEALSAENYSVAMMELAKLQPYVDRFFDKVIVNADDAELRINRLRLLAKIRRYVDSIADFSKIES